MTAPVRCSICSDPCAWVAAENVWTHIAGNHTHAAAVPPSPEADALRQPAEDDYAAYRERVRRSDYEYERALDSWRRGLEA